MYPTNSKRKGASVKGGRRKKRGEDGSRTSKKAASTVCKNATKEGVGRRPRKNRGGGQQDRKRSSSNSDTNGRAMTKNQRRRRRRRRRNQENQEKVQVQAEVSGSKGRRKKGRRKRKPKREAQAEKENVLCSESSGSVSHLALSSISCGSQPGCSHSSSFVECSLALPMEVDNLPWANLKVPMDLSHVHLEINGHGVDFDLQARKNHERWLSNVEKARE